MPGPVWNDPLGYDPLVNGPPYFKLSPQQKQDLRVFTAGVKGPRLKLSSLDQALPGGDLGSLVSVLRAVSLIHQAHHWQTHGPLFVADHGLFERLYSAFAEEIDAVAERAVGLGNPLVLQPHLQAKQVDRMMAALYGAQPLSVHPEQMVALSLQAEVALLAFLADLLAYPGLTDGTVDLLTGICDTHETHTYLLQQRSAQVPLGSVAWKQ